MFNIAGLPFALVESHLMLEQETPVKLSAMRGTGNKRLDVNIFTQHCSGLEQKFQNPTSVDLHRLNVDDLETTQPKMQMSAGSASMLESNSIPENPSLATPVSNTDARTPKYTTLRTFRFPLGQTRSLSGSAPARQPHPCSTPTSMLTICSLDEQPADVCRQSRT